MEAWLYIIGGGVLLYLGAEWFVAGASAIALGLGIPQLIIGLTVVAYGTSAPEVVVSVGAAASGHAAVALGNVVGSNIVNIGFILGLSTLLMPARVDGVLRRRELPVLVVSAAMVPLMLLDGAIAIWEAAGLIGLALGYSAWMIVSTRSARQLELATADVAAAGAAADAAGAPASTSSVGRSALITLGGLGLLLLGGRIFVDGAVDLAKLLGVSDRVIGVTIVAIGTSLPELITSLVAARKGFADIAIGNVIGSNIFNVLFCLGSAALVGNVGMPMSEIGFDLVALAVMTGLMALYIRRERTISRVEGGVALGLYLAYLAATLTR